jgi:hypothetical protein
MVTFECPWCTEPIEIERSSVVEVACEHCAITIELAPDPVRRPIERAA